MPATVTYCEVADLDWGSMQAPANAQYWVDRGCEEIDSIIGLRYATPIVFGNNSEQRPGKLLLKRINSWLAMGRAILAQSTGGEDNTLHAQGLYYVTESLKALKSIAEGETVLPGVDLATPASDKQTGPLIKNLDSQSLVEGFDSVFGSPAANSLSIQRSAPLGYPYTW